jgi:ABC-type sulfate transport system substrate-binding protein
MGVPVTTVANAMQSSSVMEGKHTVDVGMLVLPVLIELISLIADTANIKYTSGLEGNDRVRGSLVDMAVMKLDAKKIEDNVDEEEPENEMVIEEMKTAADKRAGGLMARRN